MHAIDKPRFRISADENLAAGLHRVLSDQLAYASRLLASDPDSGSIYEVRKSLKRVRSLLRLSRFAFTKREFRQHNLGLAGIGRILAAGRDRDVMLASFTDVVTKDLADEDFTQARQQLSIARERAQSSLSAKGLERARQEFEQEQNALASLDFQQIDPKLLARGFKRIRRNITQRYQALLTEPSVENLHELRKQVKHARYAVRLLSKVWKSGRAEWKKLTKTVTDELGDDHDLALLREWAASDKAAFEEAVQREHFLAVVDRRRSDLQRTALGQVATMLDARPRGLARALRQLETHLPKEAAAKKERTDEPVARDARIEKPRRKSSSARGGDATKARPRRTKGAAALSAGDAGSRSHKKKKKKKKVSRRS